MKQLILSLTILLSGNCIKSQIITNIVLLGDKGITENIKYANGFILVKKYPDGSFERKDYKLHGPLKVMKTYTDSTLQVLNGRYCSYKLNGSVNLLGFYRNNKKEDKWYHLNDTGKVILVDTYLADSLVSSKIPENPGLNQELKDGEKEAEFNGGLPALKKFLIKNLDPDVSLKSVKGGQVRIGFRINTNGVVEDIHLRKSVEYVLDEEALRVISKMPAWIPAEQDGKKVNAYRIQPLTFAIREN